MTAATARLTSALIITLFTGAMNNLFAQQPVDFESQIRPLLVQRCGECHGPKVQKSGLRLDARHAAMKGGDSGPAIVASRSADSELMRRVTSASSDDRMPPEGAALDSKEIELLRRWIDSGAEWPETDYDREAMKDPRRDHWSFQPIRPVMVPDTTAVESQFGVKSRNEIDHFVLSKLQENGLRPSIAADRRTLIRRATLDLTGLPADPDRIQRFVNDPRETNVVWAELIDELLASPRYGERWAQHWLDVIRYADTHGFEVNTPRDNAWPYRDYVIQSLNDDKPYDQFVREQLAGDVFNADAATGFLVASAVLLPGQIGADEESKRLARQDALDEIIVGTSNTLLGLTIGCARCHDHKFDPITTQDYYSLQSFFAGVEYGDRPMRDADHEEKIQRASMLSQQIDALQNELQSFEPLAFSGSTLILDEEDQRLVTWLKKENGPGANPEGTQRGYKDDPGSADQVPNISRGRYTWWNNVPGEDMMTYNPGVSGKYRLWLSWGAHGSGVHTRDARYVLDRDGNLATRDDQSEVAKIDQYFQAGVSTGETEQRPLWSGLLSAGTMDLTPESRLILRGGQTGTGITADVIVLQQVPSTTTTSVSSESTMPQLPAFRSAVSPLQNVERFAPIAARYVRLTTYETINSNQHEPCIDELEIYSSEHGGENIALASRNVKVSSSGNYSDIGIHQLKHINDGRYGNSNSWISNQHGGGWVQLELPEVTQIDRIVWGRDREGKFQDRLPVRYDVSVSVNGTDWMIVASHHDRVPMGTPYDPIQALVRNGGGVSPNLQQKAAELDQLRKEKTQLEAPRMVFSGTFREPDKTFVLRRGDPEQRLEETRANVPAIFTSMTKDAAIDTSRLAAEPTPALTDDQSRRLQLANWIASPQNPLAARVMVNRIWQNHFGRGFVDTSNDFGINGARPSHPELLDWLAAEFIRSGWSMKHLHRLIMESATYQQSSQIDLASVEKDRDNIYLWRFASRRIESEAIRDCILSVSSELNLKMYGPGFNFFKSRGGLDGFPPREDFTPEEMRRMIYSHKVRMEQVPVFGAFDCPDAGQSMPRRGRSTTALQALNLFNSSFAMDRASRLAERAIRECPDGLENQIHRIFSLAYGRPASAEELHDCVEVANKHGLATVCRAVLNSSEFLFLP